MGLAIIVILAGAWQKPRASPTPKLPTAEEINVVLKELSDITGFRIRKQLPFALITRDQVNQYLKEQIQQSVKPDEIRAEETTLKKFGFAPADFDLKQTTIDLLTEQAAAFYDFKRKKLFISDWATVNMRDVALIHELAHALADQNFPIQKFTNKGPDNSESSLAREAVVEGQASWLMLEVGARRIGRTLADPQTAREFLETGSDTATERVSGVQQSAALSQANPDVPLRRGPEISAGGFPSRWQTRVCAGISRPADLNHAN